MREEGGEEVREGGWRGGRRGGEREGGRRGGEKWRKEKGICCIG